MSMWRAAVLVVGCTLTACPSPQLSDDQDADPGDDAPSGASLRLEIKLDADLPAQIDSDISVEEIYISAVSVRAIGDAGDASKLDYEMTWDDRVKPDAVTFDNPPVGAYSTIDIRIARRADGDTPKAFEIKGAVRVGGSGFTPYRITGETGVVTASPSVMVSVMPGKAQTVKLELDVSHLVDAIDWSFVDKDDGMYVLDDANVDQMATVRDALHSAFKRP